MPEASNDLPNPLETAAPSSKSADDLVAQLAEKAIDQMLADKEIERPENAVAVVDAPSTAIEEPEKTIENQVASVESQLDSLLTDLVQPAGNSVAAAPAASFASPVETPAAQVAAPVAPEPVATPAPAEEPAPATTKLNQSEVDDLVGTYSGPRDSDIARAQTDVQTLLHNIEPSGPSGPNPLVILLEWINMPFNFIPARTKTHLGNIAILTLINALAVLAYVMYLRWK